MGKHAIALLLITAACATYGSMPPEDTIPELVRLKEAAKRLPNQQSYVTVEGGYKIAFRQTEGGKGKRVIVLIHGVFSNRDTWRFVVGDLGQDHDLLLIDLPGCGDSDKPDPDEVGQEFYSPSNLAKVVLQVLRERTEGRDITVVGHSLGGMVVLRMLGDMDLHEEYADVVGRIDTAVLCSSVDFAIKGKNPEFENLATASGFLVALAAAFGLLKEKVSRAVVQGTSKPSRMPREEAERLIDALRNRETRRAGQAMILQAVPFTEEGWPDWPKIRKLCKDYKNVKAHCLVLWGEQDPNFSQAMAFKLQIQLPRAWLKIMKDCMHQLPSEAPVELATEIRGFVATRGGGIPKIRDVY